jgi:type VI secretion system secreted protein Hcp
MTLILLQPGDIGIFGGERGWSSDGSPLANQLQEIVGDSGPAFPLLSSSQTIEAPPSSGTPLASPSLLCTRLADRLSVILYSYCARKMLIGAGRDRPSTLFLAWNPVPGTFALMTYALHNATIESIAMTSAGEAPTEQFTLTFDEVLYAYDTYSGVSPLPGATKLGWSYTMNQPIEQFSS